MLHIPLNDYHRQQLQTPCKTTTDHRTRPLPGHSSGRPCGGHLAAEGAMIAGRRAAGRTSGGMCPLVLEGLRSAL
jgi:hypothetical protein